jgi:hypothetical protein
MHLIHRIRAKIGSLLNFPRTMLDRLELIQHSLGRIEARQTAAVSPGDLEASEFKVSSQWGEDGIIEHLLRHVPIERKIFVEFGVQDYQEANTRFLLVNRNWSGLVIDGAEENIGFIRRDDIYWRFNLKSECAFINRNNINTIISKHGITGDIGILSIDIDGNDYWVWEAIDCISPRVVITEYNALFGPSAPVSIPYDENFMRTRAHYSNLYWGCSLAALESLGQRKGYVLVGCNSAGNNAFFVRRDMIGTLPARKTAEAFRPASFRESRNPDGALSFLDREAALLEIGELPLEQVTDGARILARDLPRSQESAVYS